VKLNVNGADVEVDDRHAKTPGVAVRARPADFGKWGEHGAEGWSFAERIYQRVYAD
jgi:hypothetical protein